MSHIDKQMYNLELYERERYAELLENDPHYEAWLEQVKDKNRA